MSRSPQIPDESISHKKVLAIAVPVMFSNISTPLIGVVDTAIVGQIPNPSHIGAVAISAMFFSLIYWGFGFLRMGTTSLAAQSVGAKNPNETRAILFRAITVAVVLGTSMVVLQLPIMTAGFFFIDASDLVESLSREYFEIRIWSAPVTFVNYALIGWFIGIGNPRFALLVQVVLNLLNAALDWYFVVEMGMGVKGVAIGTLFAEVIAAILGLVIASLSVRKLTVTDDHSAIWNIKRLRHLFNVSKDIMIRSLALMFVFAWFTLQSAKNGDLILAANAILLHFVTTTAYFLDGFAIAAESLAGRAFGAINRKSFIKVCKTTIIWSALIAVLASFILALTGPWIINILTIEPNVRLIANQYVIWAACAPLVATWCYQLDGIFLGATWTREMVKSMLISTSLFILVWWLMTPLGNAGLWLAIYFHFVARGLSLAYYYPALLDRDLPVKILTNEN